MKYYQFWKFQDGRFRHLDLGTTWANTCFYSWTAVASRWRVCYQLGLPRLVNLVVALDWDSIIPVFQTFGCVCEEDHFHLSQPLPSSKMASKPATMETWTGICDFSSHLRCLCLLGDWGNFKIVHLCCLFWEEGITKLNNRTRVTD